MYFILMLLWEFSIILDFLHFHFALLFDDFYELYTPSHEYYLSPHDFE
jgi:hypothetical protein